MLLLDSGRFHCEANGNHSRCIYPYFTTVTLYLPYALDVAMNATSPEHVMYVMGTSGSARCFNECLLEATTTEQIVSLTLVGLVACSTPDRSILTKVKVIPMSWLCVFERV